MNPIPPLPEDLDLDSDEAGDKTIRPCRPELRAALEAEREKLRGCRITRDGILDEEGNLHPAEVDIDSDEPGDNTIRPCRPELRAALEAEREKLRRWRALKNSPAQEPPAADSPDHKDSA
jgi:hypothetical protein